MIPIPQYPLYSAALSLCNGVQVPYYLEEDKHWSMDVAELERSLKKVSHNSKLISKARSEGVEVRALCVINPGNPTGQCLTSENIAEIIKFCQRERLVICADEVYQTNIYTDVPFTSFKKVLMELGLKDVELFSFHSISKGMIGECGRRGGYFECEGVDQGVM
jgi:aspartate/methionine/tyrosine aminotransferase